MEWKRILRSQAGVQSHTHCWNLGWAASVWHAPHAANMAMLSTAGPGSVNEMSSGAGKDRVSLEGGVYSGRPRVAVSPKTRPSVGACKKRKLSRSAPDSRGISSIVLVVVRRGNE